MTALVIPLPIYRSNRVMRGVYLEAGEHRLIFRYRPASVIWGAAISAASLLLIGIAAVVRFRRARKAPIRLPA